MRNFTRRQIVLACAPGVCIFLMGIIAGVAGYRINLTPSLPKGFWRITNDNNIERGTYASACIPLDAPMMAVAIAKSYLPDGHCPGGYAPLLKKIVAVSGDTVTLTRQSVIVNGQIIPNTATLAYRVADPLPAIARGTYVVGENEYWLIANEHPRSFDSRYFGALHRRDIEHGMRPVLVFD